MPPSQHIQEQASFLTKLINQVVPGCGRVKASKVGIRKAMDTLIWVSPNSSRSTSIGDDYPHELIRQGMRIIAEVNTPSHEAPDAYRQLFWTGKGVVDIGYTLPGFVCGDAIFIPCAEEESHELAGIWEEYW